LTNKALVVLLFETALLERLINYFVHVSAHRCRSWLTPFAIAPQQPLPSIKGLEYKLNADNRSALVDPIERSRPVTLAWSTSPCRRLWRHSTA